MTSLDYKKLAHPIGVFEGESEDVCTLLQEWCGDDELDNGGEFDLSADGFVYILYDCLGDEKRFVLDGVLDEDILYIDTITAYD
jgi:hypothetical protein